MEKWRERVFEKYSNDDITDNILQEAAILFNENYGVWSKDAAKLPKSLKPGNRVKLSKNRLRSECIPDDNACSYVRLIVDGHLAGHVIACRWLCAHGIVCWVTQLVVHRKHRRQGHAVSMLSELRHPDDAVYGIMSSNPAACVAAAKAFGGDLSAIRLDYIQENAEAIIKSCPAAYVKEAKLRGSLFLPNDTRDVVSSADTDFWVDHTEPLEILAEVQTKS